MKLLQKVLGAWDVCLALLSGIFGALLLPRAAFQGVTDDIITFFAIQSAVILPAMMFTAGMLRSDGVSLDEARRFQGALRLQMRFWITLLALDFVAVCLLIFGKAIEWKLLFQIVLFHLHVWINLGAGLTCVVVTLCVLRMIPFVKGVRSLLEMNGKLVEMSIVERERRRIDEIKLEEKPLDLPPGYGEIVKRH